MTPTDVEIYFQQGLDVAHTELALDELAKYHAVTHAFIMDKARNSSLPQTLKVRATKLYKSAARPIAQALNKLLRSSSSIDSNVRKHLYLT